MDIFYSVGALTLTTDRLIWTPFPYIADISPWTVTRTDLQNVSLQQDDRLLYRFQTWMIRVETANGTRRFGFGNLLDRRGQRTKTDHWVGAIQEWMN